MSRNEYRKLITIDPQLKNGEPCIRGLPILVYEIISQIIAGASEAQLLAKYPPLTHADIWACLIYAAERPKPMFVLKDEDLWPNTALEPTPTAP